MKEKAIPIGLILTLVGGAMGYGELKGKVKENEKKVEKAIEKAETKEEKLDDYLLEQRDINTEQTMQLEYIEKMLKKIDEKL